MVYSAISLLPTMEQGAHLVGVGSSLPSLSEDEEDDDVVSSVKVNLLISSLMRKHLLI